MDVDADGQRKSLFKSAARSVIPGSSEIPLCIGVFVYLGIIPILFVFLYQWRPTFVYVVIFVLFAGALVPLHARQQGSPLASFLTVGVLCATMGGFRLYYSSILPFATLSMGRVAYNVYPDAHAAAYSDIAVSFFAGNAAVDGTRTVGMTSLEGGIHTYCVAPISATSGASAEQGQDRIEFWAVGVDCCLKTANFMCDDAGETGSRTGYVLRDASDGDAFFSKYGKHLAPPIQRRDLFLKAIHQAEALHGVASSSYPSLVQWKSASPDYIRSYLWWTAFNELVFGNLLPIAVASILLWRFVAKYLKATVQMRRQCLDPPAFYVYGARRRLTELRLRQLIGPSWERVFMRGFLLPFIVLLGCVTMASWMPCLWLGDLYVSVIVAGLLVIVAAMILSPHGSAYGMLLLIAVIIGTSVGSWNYKHHARHYCEISSHRTYSKDVLADANSAEYQDAGKIHFAEDVRVSGMQSIGFQYRGAVFCAAPIIAGGCSSSDKGCSPPTPMRVDFWAVGMNCCGARGEFSCGGANDNEAHAGIVLRSSLDEVPDQMTWNYLRATRAAAEHHGLPVSEKPMLLRWGRNLDALQWQIRGEAVGIILLTAIIGFISLTILCLVLIYWQRLRSMQKQQWGSPTARAA